MLDVLDSDSQQRASSFSYASFPDAIPVLSQPNNSATT
jgi:hypothetical protein